MKIESEKLLERKLFRKIESMGGIAFKIPALHISGIPDRICLMPMGRMFFAEVKTTNQKPRKIQLVMHKKLRDRGFRVEIIESTENIENVLKDYE